MGEPCRRRSRWGRVALRSAWWCVLVFSAVACGLTVSFDGYDLSAPVAEGGAAGGSYAVRGTVSGAGGAVTLDVDGEDFPPVSD